MDGAQLILYTEGHRLTGNISTGRQRLSDLLNNPNTGILELQQATFQEMLTTREPESVGRLTVRKDEVMLAIPMDGPQLGARVQTQQFHVEVACPLFSIVGDLHRRPSDPSNFNTLIGGFNRIFIPLSTAKLRYLPNGVFDAEVDVVLVDSRKIQFWSVDPTPVTRIF
jgi:hypothetical protein